MVDRRVKRRISDVRLLFPGVNRTIDLRQATSTVTAKRILSCTAKDRTTSIRRVIPVLSGRSNGELKERGL